MVLGGFVCAPRARLGRFQDGCQRAALAKEQRNHKAAQNHKSARRANRIPLHKRCLLMHFGLFLSCALAPPWAPLERGEVSVVQASLPLLCTALCPDAPTRCKKRAKSAFGAKKVWKGEGGVFINPGLLSDYRPKGKGCAKHSLCPLACNRTATQAF